MTNKQQTTDAEEVWGNIELPGFGDDQLLSPNLNYVLAGMAMAKDPKWRANQKLGAEKRAVDPEWQAKNKLAAEKRAADPEWQANIKLANQLKAQDPEWQANHKLGVKKRSTNPEWQANKKLAGEKQTELYKDPTKCHGFKGPSIGIHMETGEIVMLCGDREMRAAGFDPGSISGCINGKKPHYKKYIWSRDEPV